jgi:simple sugar transport system permease protein
MVISGALAGIVGFMQVSGADFTLNETTAGGVGFTAIIVAWLSQLNPLIMILVSFFIAMLERGAIRIQTTFMIPATIATVLIGMILFFMLASEFFINYRLTFRSRRGGAKHG